jgi:hypothetical protein
MLCFQADKTNIVKEIHTCADGALARQAVRMK